MIVTRRSAIGAGGVVLAGLLTGRARAGNAVEIVMKGKPGGSHVWFDPVGILVKPGATIRWTNLDAGNVHTVTAYHPNVAGRPRRIPEKAAPWNSDYLMPQQSFSMTFAIIGVYDYYCIPHEHAGMVGRIIVGEASVAQPYADAPEAGLEPLPDIALNAFPSISDIMAKGIVRRA